jgi:hypothetical protein
LDSIRFNQFSTGVLTFRRDGQRFFQATDRFIVSPCNLQDGASAIEQFGAGPRLLDRLVDEDQSAVGLRWIFATDRHREVVDRQRGLGFDLQAMLPVFDGLIDVSLPVGVVRKDQ